jgi:hypothetical protein
MACLLLEVGLMFPVVAVGGLEALKFSWIKLSLRMTFSVEVFPGQNYQHCNQIDTIQFETAKWLHA